MHLIVSDKFGRRLFFTLKCVAAVAILKITKQGHRRPCVYLVAPKGLWVGGEDVQMDGRKGERRQF